MRPQFSQLFPIRKPIIGMIHLAGQDSEEKANRALEELEIFEQEGVDGAIIEDYHGAAEDVQNVLRQSQGRFGRIVRGVNVLRNPYSGLELADKYDAKFVQFDNIPTAGLRARFPRIAILGGVGFKYQLPTGNALEADLSEGKLRCDAIVTTGSGTGVETPIEKLRQYKQLLGEFPLVVGAGVTLQNAYEQLRVCDGAIVGSYFKPDGNTERPVERNRVRDLMDVAQQVRREQ